MQPLLCGLLQPVLRPLINAIRTGFSVRQLFSSGEQGVWYDPSDFTTLFQDSAGTTPVTAVEQPCGLMLDKSKGLVLGAELAPNSGTFSSATGWVTGAGTSIASNVATSTAVAPGTTLVSMSGIAVVGKTYLVTITVDSISGALIRPVLFGSVLTSNAFTTSGTYTFRLLATNTDAYIQSYGGTLTSVVSKFSVRELPGNHATQATSANRPVVSARVNLLTKTEDFSSSDWQKSGVTVTLNADTVPNSSITLNKVVETATTAVRYLYENNSSLTTSGVTYILSAIAKYAGRYLTLEISNAISGNAFVFFDLQAGVVSQAAAVAGTGFSTPIATITDVGNGCYRVVLSATKTNTSGGVESFISLSNSATGASDGVSYLGNGVSGAYIGGADLRVANQGVNLPSYQRVNTATDYDTVGFPTYLAFNGTNSSMATGSIDFTSTDKMTVVMGIRKLTTAASLPFEAAGTFNGVDGGYGLVLNDASPSDYFGFRGVGAGAVLGKFNGGAVPVSSVLVASMNQAGATNAEQLSTRRNGVNQSLAYAGALGAPGSFLNGPFYIGMRGGVAVPFNGNIYSLIVRGAQSSAAQIASGERFVATKTGITL